MTAEGFIRTLLNQVFLCFVSRMKIFQRYIDLDTIAKEDKSKLNSLQRQSEKTQFSAIMRLPLIAHHRPKSPNRFVGVTHAVHKQIARFINTQSSIQISWIELSQKRIRNIRNDWSILFGLKPLKVAFSF